MSKKEQKTDDIPELIEEPETYNNYEELNDYMRERHAYKPQLIETTVYRLPEDAVTSEVMTRFEYAEVISIRAKQIENGGPIFTNIGNLTDPIDIAKQEIADKKCPLTIIRMIAHNIEEKWNVNDMAIPQL